MVNLLCGSRFSDASNCFLIDCLLTDLVIRTSSSPPVAERVLTAVHGLAGVFRDRTRGDLRLDLSRYVGSKG